MKLVAIVAMLNLFALGCTQPAPPLPPAPKATASTAPEVAPAPREAVTTPETEFSRIGKDAEPLPPAPKADPSHTHKPLTPDGTLLLEVKPDPTDPKKTKPVRVLVQTEVCLRQGVLEVFVCRTNTKEHEAILRTAIDARFLHSALIAVGAKPGSPVQFINPTTDREEYKPATGTKIAVSVHYRRAGELHTHAAQEWIRDMNTKKPMAHDWVFAGSRFVKDPENPDRPAFYTANNGEVIAISNFVDSMLDLPVPVSRENADLNFEVITTKVTLTSSPPAVASRARLWTTAAGLWW